MTVDKKQYCDLCIGAGLVDPATAQANARMHGDNALAIVDGPTKRGAWAHMCKRHLTSVGFPGSPMNTGVNGKRGA